MPRRVYDQTIDVKNIYSGGKKISIGQIAFACAGSLFNPQPVGDVIEAIDEITSHLVGMNELSANSVKAVLSTLISIGLLKWREGETWEGGEFFIDEQEMARLRLWRSGLQRAPSGIRLHLLVGKDSNNRFRSRPGEDYCCHTSGSCAFRSITASTTRPGVQATIIPNRNH